MSQFNLEWIPRDADEYMIKRAFADVLHSGDFSQSRGRLNFKIVLGNTGSGHLHAGYGALILPNEGAGKQLRAWLNAGNVVKVCQRKIKVISWPFVQDKNKRYLQEVIRVPFVEPEKEQARRELIERLKQDQPRFMVSAVEFGILSWDKATRKRIFSVEASISSPACITFPFNEHRLRGPQQIRIVLDSSGMYDTFDTVVLTFSGIAQIEVGTKPTKHSSQSFIIFELLRPAVFEREPTWPGEDRKFRQRLASLNARHQEVAPYAYHVRVRLRENYSAFSDFYEFLGRKEPPLSIRVTALSDPTLTPSVVETVQAWLSSMEWTTAFQTEMLLCSSLVTSKQLCNDLRKPIDSLRASHPNIISDFLRSFAVALRVSSRSGEESPLECFVRLTRELEEGKLKVGLLTSDEEIFCAHHITLTPTRKVLEGPYPTDSNRVIRSYRGYQDHFLRVDFRDEDLASYRFGWEVDGEPFLHDCVGKVLKKGFTIAGRDLQFLGYSTSSLREHSVWFMHPFTDSTGNRITVESIRAALGDFSRLLRTPARYAARLGQAFTATIPSITVQDDEIEYVDDLGSHTDGCGTISRVCADEIWETICKSNPERYSRALQPSSYQIRFQGCKGMVAVDENLTEFKMRLRPSMRKFTGSGHTLEIARYFNYPMKAYMNRPLITVLEHRGVSIDALEELQRRAVANVHLADRTVEGSRSLVADYSVGRAYSLQNILKNLPGLESDSGTKDEAKEKPIDDVFIRRLITMTQYHALVDIKNHARILLERGWLLPGVADEGPAYQARGVQGVRRLEIGHIYACIQSAPDEDPVWLTGSCIIWRNPVIHPGDLTRVWAVGKPPDDGVCFYRGKKNVLILPSVGDRSLASQLAGGDVDGDLFYVSKESSIFPPLFEAPAPSDAEDPARKDKVIDDTRDVTFDDVCDFVVDYIDSNNVGLIADRHILRSDQCKDGPSDHGCKELAKLYSRAVDFPKTGTKVEMPKLSSLPIPYKPDWHATGDEEDNPENYYRSDRALGVLYRNIPMPKLHLDSAPQQRPRQLSDPLTSNLKRLVQGHIPTADMPTESPLWLTHLFEGYQNELRYVCATHAVSPNAADFLLEEEVVLGIVLDAKDRRMQKDRSQRIRTHAASLVRNVKRTLSVAEDEQITLQEALEDTLQRAWSGWCFSVGRGNSGGDGQAAFGAASFALIALGVIFDAADDLRKLHRFSP